MAGLGIGIAFIGYSVFYYGVTQVQSGNWGFLDLIIPSRWAGAAATPRDGGAQSSTPPAQSGGGTPGASPANPQTQYFPGSAPVGVPNLPGSVLLGTTGGTDIFGNPVPTQPYRPTPGR